MVSAGEGGTAIDFVACCDISAVVAESPVVKGSPLADARALFTYGVKGNAEPPSHGMRPDFGDCL